MVGLEVHGNLNPLVMAHANIVPNGTMRYIQLKQWAFDKIC